MLSRVYIRISHGLETEIFEKVPEMEYVETAVETNLEEFERVVRSRRSTREFRDEKVPEEVMRRCLELALLAPNSSNLQSWEFYWVRDEAKKQDFGSVLSGATRRDDGAGMGGLRGAVGYLETQLQDDDRAA
ncbi:unnamed protein product [marine sediment metagenome]|uniref:Nitroreductase domain-containing protein n=1 Tax=marine sediment metagenome TaxID=412755 RepID=X1D4R8_9ZZZZ